MAAENGKQERLAMDTASFTNHSGIRKEQP